MARNLDWPQIKAASDRHNEEQLRKAGFVMARLLIKANLMVGDRVVLKSGGPIMTVTMVTSNTPGFHINVGCAWLGDDGKKYSEFFYTACIMKLTEIELETFQAPSED